MLPSERPYLMWVTDRRRSDAPLPYLAREISSAGADIVQVREPDLTEGELESLVRSIRFSVRAGTNVIVNSNIELARRLGIGLQLPEKGPSIAEARRILGSRQLVGRSVHSTEAAIESRDADFVIAGHIFATGSKPDREPLGLDRFERIVRSSPVPVLGIGGIIPERVPAVMRRGAAGIAIMSPLTRIADAHETTERFRFALDGSMLDSLNNGITATVNGKRVELSAGTTVAAFLASRELHERLVVVERNGEIIKRSTFPDVIIEDGDLLEVVHFVGGG